MKNKKLFYNKKNYTRKIYYLFFFLVAIVIISFFYFILADRKNLFSIEQNLNSFYAIPLDREGKKIENQEKKILHLDYTNKDNIDLINDPNLKYSIQLFSSDDYKSIINFRSKLINNDTIFLSKDLFIAILNYDLISEYLLLFKNFNTRKNALEYCEKYTYYLEKCIIVNVNNLD